MPSVFADFNGDPNVISNPESSNIIQATINSAYSTEDSAQARESREIVDIDDLDVNKLARLSEKKKISTSRSWSYV